jgi:hypothetical protein
MAYKTAEDERAYQRSRYWSMPPSECHPDRREHAGGWCRSCYRTKGKRARRADCHPERLHVAKGLCKPCYDDLPANKERARQVRRLKKYGLTQEEYELIVARQGDQCAICSDPHEAIDHCHGGGGVRGLLCDRCNIGLGPFRDDLELLKSAVRYLQKKPTNKNKKGQHGTQTRE